jgi:hypothetical protein
MYKDVDRDEKERTPRNRPEKKRVGHYFLTAECFAHSPKYRMELWCLPLNVPQDKVETREWIRYSLAQFRTFTRTLTDAERQAAWVKLTAAAIKHGIELSVPAKLNTPKPAMAPMPPRATATHRMTVTW